jgi:hypothetical protein
LLFSGLLEAALAECVVNDIYSEGVVATHIERLYVSPVKLNREQHGMTQDSTVDGEYARCPLQ